MSNKTDAALRLVVARTTKFGSGADPRASTPQRTQARGSLAHPESLSDNDFHAAVELTAAWIRTQMPPEHLDEIEFAGERNPSSTALKLALLGRTIAAHALLEHADDWHAVTGTPELQSWAAFARALGLIEGTEFRGEDLVRVVSAYREELVERYADAMADAFRARLASM
jgi:hypothetical protein